MRHRKHRHQLGRKKEHRAALMANLAAALLKHDQIKTTISKAKALRPFVEKIITMAKKAHGASPERALAYRRLAMARVRDQEAIALLFREKVTEFVDRPGGYTRIYKLGQRVGDAAEIALIQLIPGSDEGYEKKKARPAKKKEATPAPAAAEEVEVAEPVVEAEVVEAAPEEAKDKE
jgi:large subunit ribosomal protein L17|tara:strand:+ start:3949 stop:4479 length:531 start_codon:yes stop_codon:yes gene_type:complete